jgi:hypothetical protein
MHADLDRIEAALRRLRQPSASRLQGSLPAAAGRAALAGAGLAITGEMERLYAWRNGTRSAAGDLLTDLWFFPGFWFPPLDEAIRNYRERVVAPRWRKGWFPIFLDGAGDFYLVPCRKTRRETTGVIGFLHGEPEQPVEYTSLPSMIKTLADAYDTGAIVVDADGALEFDEDGYRRIAEQLNPGIDVWRE